MVSTHYTMKRRRLTTVRDLFFMILTATAFLSLFLALFVPMSCTRGKTVYFACAGSYTTAARAQEKAEQVQRSGGGGYVLSDGAYFVLAAVYLSEKDCEEIVSNIDGYQKWTLSVHHYDLVRDMIRTFSGWYYDLDRKTRSAAEILPEVKEYASRADFDPVLEPEQQQLARSALTGLARLTETDLSVNLKYYQCLLTCLFRV